MINYSVNLGFFFPFCSSSTNSTIWYSLKMTRISWKPLQYSAAWVFITQTCESSININEPFFIFFFSRTAFNISIFRLKTLFFFFVRSFPFSASFSPLVRHNFPLQTLFTRIFSTRQFIWNFDFGFIVLLALIHLLFVNFESFDLFFRFLLIILFFL